MDPWRLTGGGPRDVPLFISFGGVRLHFEGVLTFVPAVGELEDILRLEVAPVLTDTFDFHAGLGTSWLDHVFVRLQCTGDAKPFAIEGTGRKILPGNSLYDRQVGPRRVSIQRTLLARFLVALGSLVIVGCSHKQRALEIVLCEPKVAPYVTNLPGASGGCMTSPSSNLPRRIQLQKRSSLRTAA